MKKKVKKYKRYKYFKVNPKMEKKMRKLRKEGLSYWQISKKLGVSEITVEYHLNKDVKKRVKIDSANKKYPKKKVSKKKNRDYHKNRYHNDQQFRKRQLKASTKSVKKLRKERKKLGLCTSCGGERIDKRWFECESCRKYKRNNARKIARRKNARRK